jgi:hypothetical protein
MCSLDVRFTVKCVIDVIFEFSTLKMTLNTHSTRKRTSKLDIQNASVIDPIVCKVTLWLAMSTIMRLIKTDRHAFTFGCMYYVACCGPNQGKSCDADYGCVIGIPQIYKATFDTGIFSLMRRRTKCMHKYAKNV